MTADPGLHGAGQRARTATRQTGSVLGVAVFGSLVAAHGRFIYGFRTAQAISIGLVITGMLLASRIRQPAQQRQGPSQGAPDRQTGGARADTHLVRDHRRPYSPERAGPYEPRARGRSRPGRPAYQ